MLTNKIYNNFAVIDKDQTNIRQGSCMAMQVSVVFLFIPFYFFVNFIYIRRQLFKRRNSKCRFYIVAKGITTYINFLLFNIMLIY